MSSRRRKPDAFVFFKTSWPFKDVLKTNNWILFIYIQERFNLVYLMLIPMFSLYSWFLYCNTCSKSTKNRKPNENISTEWANVLSIIHEKLLFYREVICFLINNFFENVFQTSRVIGLITLVSNCMWNSDAKKVFKLLEKVFSSLSVHFRVISMF